MKKRNSPSSGVRLVGNIQSVSFGDMRWILTKEYFSKKLILIGHQEAEGDHMLKRNRPCSVVRPQELRALFGDI